MKKRVLIVEDEIIIAEHILDLLENLGYEVVAIASQVSVALDWIERQRPDLVLIDITLYGELDGVYLANVLNERFGIPFVFISSLSDPLTVKRASETGPRGYLVKPFKEQDVYVALEMVWAKQGEKSGGATPDALAVGEVSSPPEDALFIRDRSQRIRVAFQDLYCLEAQGNYTTVYAKSGKFSVCRNLRHVERQLPKVNFVRVHKSYIVSTNNIISIKNKTLILSDGTRVPIGRTYQNELFKRVNEIS